MKRFITIFATTALLVGSLTITATAQEHLTGLERAAIATLQGLEKSQGKSADAPGQVNRAKGLNNDGDKLTGRARAAGVIDAAIARGNGSGNAHGRGQVGYIHQILADGEIPGQIDGQNHGQAVREMVHTFNELRRSE
jgi:hypothetical protein